MATFEHVDPTGRFAFYVLDRELVIEPGAQLELDVDGLFQKLEEAHAAAAARREELAAARREELDALLDAIGAGDDPAQEALTAASAASTQAQLTANALRIQLDATQRAVGYLRSCTWLREIPARKSKAKKSEETEAGETAAPEAADETEAVS